MIISRAPVRITLGGGGTDLKSYYSKFGGFIIAAAIDKYIFIAANKRFYPSTRLSYSQTEVVKCIDEARHPIFREALRLLNVNTGIELVSVADVPANCGLGTSSSFTVSLLNALHAYKREFVTQKQLAEEACHIEIDMLREPIGKQDQYISAFGGVTCITFDKNGDALVEPLRISDEAMDELESNLLLFYTGIERSASDVLIEQDHKSQQGDSTMLQNLHIIKEIGMETRKVLEKGDLGGFGDLLHWHWETKKKRSQKISDPFIDEIYELARKSGALGGKLIGAGGGGFFMFFCQNGCKAKVSLALKGFNLIPLKFTFDTEGAKILVNVRGH